MKPAVTVLVPTYRRPRLLARALRSIQAQTWRELVVLVCDNASGDETADVVAGFMASDPRIRYHRHPVNLGPQANFGWAFAQVASDFFCLLSDDDLLLPDGIRLAVTELLSHPQALAWSGLVVDAKMDRLTGYQPDDGWPEGLCPSFASCDLICQHRLPRNAAMVFRREVISDGFHPGYADFHISDVLWLLHAAARGGIGITRMPAAIFTHHTGSLSSAAEMDPKAAISLYWPSVRYLHAHFPKGVLTAHEHECLRAKMWITYGRDQVRRLGHLAVKFGQMKEMETCVDLLRNVFDDEQGAVELLRLRRLPRLLIRLSDGIVHRWKLLRGLQRLPERWSEILNVTQHQLKEMGIDYKIGN